MSDNDSERLVATPIGSEETEGEGATEQRAMLHAKGLVKRYGKRTVVSDVNFNVRQGEIVGLLGPNGAGKTTSFYMTTGLVVPNDGHVYLGDTEITDYPVYKHAHVGIGYLPQEASVFRKMSVEDNIMAVLERTKLSHDEQVAKMESLIKEFRLQKVRKNLGDRLSGGERRRTEIARCLAIDPKFIMLDEPFAGVDPIAVEDIQSVVWRLKFRNIGILITDHNVQDTLCITDRAYMLFEGRILFQGTPEELANNKIVKEKYLTNSFVLRKKDFQLIEEQRKAKEQEGESEGSADKPEERYFDSTENQQPCTMSNQGLIALAQLILPSEILSNFEVVRVEEVSSLTRIYLDESAKADYKENPEIESKGFCEAVTIRDFPIRDKSVGLIVRRRKWYDKQNNRYFSDSYGMKAEGTNYSKEFATFLKEVYGDDSHDLPFA